MPSSEDDILRYVERRDSIAERGIEGIDFLADVRGPIQGLAIRIGAKELETSGGMASAELKRVVISATDI
jgi:hypothetical protein